jgi:hypothetical protein
MWAHHSSASTLTLAEWPRPVACSRQADRIYRGRDPVGFQTTTRPTRPCPILYQSFRPLTILAAFLPCPTFLTKSLSCTHTTPGLPHASECYDHWFHHFSFLSRQVLSTHAPISEHPELIISYMFLRKHVQQMCRIRKMDIVVPASMREQIVHLVECGHVRDRRVDVTPWVELGQVHVSFSVD